MVGELFVLAAALLSANPLKGSAQSEVIRRLGRQGVFQKEQQGKIPVPKDVTEEFERQGIPLEGEHSAKIVPGLGPIKMVPLDPYKPKTLYRDLSDEELLDNLAKPLWWNRILDSNSDPLVFDCLWHHPSVTWLVHRCQVEPDTREKMIPQLQKALKQKTNPTLRFNAAVTSNLLGLEDERCAGELDHKFLDESEKFEPRMIAIHTLATRPEKLDEVVLRDLFDHWFPEPNQTSQTNNPSAKKRELRTSQNLVAGVLWAIVRIGSLNPYYDPRADEQVLRAANSSSARLRRVAAIAFAGRAWDVLPETLEIMLTEDTDQRVRATALAALGTHPTAAGFWAIHAGTFDKVLSVKVLAIGLLGRFPGLETSERLLTLQNGSEKVRVAVVNAAGELGDFRLLLRGAADKSFRVRKLTAQFLGEIPEKDAMRALERLSTDRSWEVQVTAVEAIGRWPTLEAVPRLLDVLESPSRQTRLAGADLLVRHWPAADKKFLVNRLPHERKRALEQLRAEWRIEEMALRPTDQAVPALLKVLGSDFLEERQQAASALARHWPIGSQFPVLEPPAVRERHLDSLRRLWRNEQDQFVLVSHAEENAARNHPQAQFVEHLLSVWYGSQPYSDEREWVIEEFLAQGPGIVPAIERRLQQRGFDPGPDLLRKVLAPLDPTYRLLAEMWDSREHQEYRLASQLTREFGDRTLTKVQAVVIARMALRSPESVLWLRLLPILERDFPAVAAQIDEEGLRHIDERVCESTCQRIGKRGWTEQGHLLDRLFDYPNSAVRVAALEAAGQLDDSTHTGRLRESMRSRSPHIRLAAAISLHQLADEEGTKELSRLAGDLDTAIRRAVIRALGEGPSHDHLAVRQILMRALGDSNLGVRRDAIESLEKITGFSFARKGRKAVPLSQQILRWKELLHQKEVPGNLSELEKIVQGSQSRNSSALMQQILRWKESPHQKEVPGNVSELEKVIQSRHGRSLDSMMQRGSLSSLIHQSDTLSTRFPPTIGRGP